MLDQSTIASILASAGFTKIHETSKVEEFRFGQNSIYLKKRGTSHPLIVHGKYATILDRLNTIPGVIRTKPRADPYHNANMRSFDERINRGQKPTRYGYDFGFRDSTALTAFLQELR